MCRGATARGGAGSMITGQPADTAMALHGIAARQEDILAAQARLERELAAARADIAAGLLCDSQTATALALAADALAAAAAAGIRGKAVTPYLLSHMQHATQGASVAVNLDVARGNIALAGQIAIAWAARVGE